MHTTLQEFADMVFEHIFVLGFRHKEGKSEELWQSIRSEWMQEGLTADPIFFADKCVQAGNLIEPASIEGILASPTAGAKVEWLAVHEAGHAIVGIMSDLTVWGVRFYGNGDQYGEAGIFDGGATVLWDQEHLENLIRTAVAGNMAQLIHPTCGAPQGRLSALLMDRNREVWPSDLLNAVNRAEYLDSLMFGVSAGHTDDDQFWTRIRRSVELAENEAEALLKGNIDLLMRLSARLQHGPISGADIRRLVQP